MVEDQKFKINFICPSFFGTSGYVAHARGLINALDKVMDVKISSQLPQDWERQVNDQELLMLKKSDSKDRIQIILDLPFNWLQYANKYFNCAWLIFEGDKIPLSWVPIIKDHRINQVWVPSTHVYNAIKNTLIGEEYEKQMTMNKVKIVPHGVNLELFKPEERKKDLFTFLINKGFRNQYDRGGMQHGIKAFIEEFKKGEARLVLKLNPAYAMSPQDLINFINFTCIQSNKKSDEIGEIIFNYDAMLTHMLKDLYNNTDVLLNPTEAEAFSLPCIESMACGKPVITTNYGGQIDFVTNSNGWLIDYELHEVRHELMYEGINWAKPDIEHIKKTMRLALSDKESYATKAQNALKQALNFTWKNSALKAQELLYSLAGGAETKQHAFP